MARALILSGGGRYGDPWHPFARTSMRLADILRADGWDAEIREDVEQALDELALEGPATVSLIVANAAAGAESDRRAGARAAVLAYLERGGGVLAVHVGASGLVAIPEWEAITGMAWVDDRSMHPPVGPSHVLAFPDRHPIATPLRDFDLHDERYSFLRVAPDVVPFVAHDYRGERHPLVWARTYHRARIVVDTLGHDERSFDSPEHRLIIERGARWATGQALR